MSKYNVSDMKGAPIPDEAIEDWLKWVEEHPLKRPNVMVAGTPDKVDEESKSPKSDALRDVLEKAGLKTVDWQLHGGVIDHSENIPPELFDKFSDEIKAITQPGNTDPFARMIDLICDLAIAEGGEDWEKFTQRARDILSVFDAEEVKKKWAGQEVPTTKWDYADEDGDVHSPAWYIEAFMVANMEYMRLHQNTPRDDDPVAMDNHMAALDDALLEAEMYERYVNKLFGYSDE